MICVQAPDNQTKGNKWSIIICCTEGGAAKLIACRAGKNNDAIVPKFKGTHACTLKKFGKHRMETKML